LEFRRAATPSTEEVGDLVVGIAEEVERWLRWEGYASDEEPAGDDDAQAMDVPASHQTGWTALLVQEVETLHKA
jgi:hypothetical protein